MIKTKTFMKFSFLFYQVKVYSTTIRDINLQEQYPIQLKSKTYQSLKKLIYAYYIFYNHDIELFYFVNISLNTF